MDELKPLPILRRDEDFNFFRKQKSLGTGFASQFETYLYATAKDAYYRSWMPGFNYEWRRYHLEMNAKASERMRMAFQSLGHGLQNESRIEPTYEEPKHDQMDMDWFKSIQRNLIFSHLRVYDSIYVIDTPEGGKFKLDESELLIRLIDFYQTSMSIAWQAGWRHGQQAARDQLDGRLERRTAEVAAAEVDREARALEQSAMEHKARLLFMEYGEPAKQPGASPMRNAM